MSTQTILLIDDCENFRLVVSNLLLDAGYIVVEASCPADAFQFIKKEKFDLILCDLHMPFMNGEEGKDFQTSYQVGIMTINELQGLFPKIPVVALTSTEPCDLERIKSALKGIKSFTKPTTKKELFTIMANVEEMVQYQNQLQ